VSEGGDLREVFASKLHEIIRATFAVLESAQAGQDNERAQKARKFLHDTAVFFAEMEATARERQFKSGDKRVLLETLYLFLFYRIAASRVGAGGICGRDVW
jgi:hypothetical protein